MAEKGESMQFTEEEHRVMQEKLNAGQQSDDDQFMRQDRVQMRRKASSLDVLFQGPNIRGFFKERNVSHIAWATLIVLIITILLLLVCMGAPGWGWTREIRDREVREGEMYGKYGLWFVCWELVEAPGTIIDYQLISDIKGIPGWFHGCQAMTVLSLIAAVIGMANSAAYICAKSMNGNPMLIASVVIFSSAAGVFAIVAFVLFAVQFLLEAYWCCESGTMQVVEWHLYYCFIICCCVPAFAIAAAILAAMEVARLRNIVRKQRYAEELDQKRASGNYEGYGYPYNMGAAYGYGYEHRPPYHPQHSGYSQGRMY